MNSILIYNIDEVHTTELGVDRIRKNYYWYNLHIVISGRTFGDDEKITKESLHRLKSVKNLMLPIRQLSTDLQHSLRMDLLFRIWLRNVYAPMNFLNLQSRMKRKLKSF